MPLYLSKFAATPIIGLSCLVVGVLDKVGAGLVILSEVPPYTETVTPGVLGIGPRVFLLIILNVFSVFSIASVGAVVLVGPVVLVLVGPVVLGLRFALQS